MRPSNYFSPGAITFNLIAGLIVGTIVFKVILAEELEGVIKNFPTGRAIAAVGLVNVTLYAIWAKRKDKTEELEYRQQLQNSLELLQQAEKKKSKEK